MAFAVSEHPVAYDWHDGHTSHYTALDAKPPLPIHKADESVPQPNSHLHPPAAPAQPIAAPLLAARRKKRAPPDYSHVTTTFGAIGAPGAPTRFYAYQGKGHEARRLVHDHGYKSFYHGGRHGIGDHAKRNYDTRWVAVSDPWIQAKPSSAPPAWTHASPDSAQPEWIHAPGTLPASGDDYTDTWRHLHELAHALTQPEINQLYGEGKRTGPLGKRTLREAKRAVHWKWLAIHKQRELSRRMGVEIPEQDFVRETNVVMRDAVMRALTGKHTNPGAEGFTPNPQKVPLESALAILDDAEAKRLAAKQQSLGKSEGEHHVKTYTVPEICKELAKAIRERVETFQPVLDQLHQKEQSPLLKSTKGKRLCPRCTKVHVGQCPKGVEAMDKREIPATRTQDAGIPNAHDGKGKLPAITPSTRIEAPGSGGKIKPGKKLSKAEEDLAVEVWLGKAAAPVKKLTANAPKQPSLFCPNDHVPDDVYAGKKLGKDEVKLDKDAPNQPSALTPNAHLPEDVQAGKSVKKDEVKLDKPAPKTPALFNEQPAHVPDDVEKTEHVCAEDCKEEHEHKKAEVPMAKPPSGKNPNAVPMSKGDELITAPLDAAPGKEKPAMVAPLNAAPGTVKPAMVAPLDAAPGKEKPAMVKPIEKALGDFDRKSGGGANPGAPVPAPTKLPGSMIRGKPMTGTPAGHIAAGAHARAPVRLPGMGAKPTTNMPPAAPKPSTNTPPVAPAPAPVPGAPKQ